MNRNGGGRRLRRAGAFAGYLAAVMLAAPAAGEGTGNVCEDQIREIVASRFNQTVKRVEFRYQPNLQSGGGQMMLSQALAYPVECPGYHFFDVLGDDYKCERQAGAGRDSNLAIYRSSGDGC